MTTMNVMGIVAALGTLGSAAPSLAHERDFDGRVQQVRFDRDCGREGRFFRGRERVRGHELREHARRDGRFRYNGYGLSAPYAR